MVVRKRTRNDLFSETLAIDRVGDPDDPYIQRLVKTFQQSEEIRLVLQSVLGEALLGMTGRSTFTILYGPTTKNGKSVFMNLVNCMYGDFYFATMSNKLITNSYDGRPIDKRREMEMAKNKRVLFFSELDENSKLDTAVLKRLTGGEKLNGCRLFQDEYSFPCTSRIFITTNNIPDFSQVEPALTSRLIVIPCLSVFGPDGDFPEDHQFIRKIREEHLPDLFAWALQGTLSFIKNNLTHVLPPEINREIQEHTVLSDPFSQFIEDHCTFRKEDTIDQPELYKKYVRYMNEKDERPITNRAFFQRIRKVCPFAEKKKLGGVYKFYGISCKE
jgi:putative DNA primase/helicase